MENDCNNRGMFSLTLKCGYLLCLLAIKIYLKIKKLSCLCQPFQQELTENCSNSGCTVIVCTVLLCPSAVFREAELVIKISI